METLQLEYDEYKNDSFHSIKCNSEKIEQSFEKIQRITHSLKSSADRDTKSNRDMQDIINESIPVEVSQEQRACDISNEESIVDELATSV